jgi:hypothetical protein
MVFSPDQRDYWGLRSLPIMLDLLCQSKAFTYRMGSQEFITREEAREVMNGAKYAPDRIGLRRVYFTRN